MATDWTSRLRRAKWRGFEFLTDSHDSTHGQRLVVTELPGADEPIVEDLGAKAPGYKVAAYFVGPQYDVARDTFLQLLAQTSAEWLTHPWLGRMRVRAHTWSVHESTDKGGFCTVTVDFVPGGQDAAAPSADAVDTAFGQIEAFADAVESDPLKMLQGGVNEFVAKAQASLGQVRNALAKARLPLTWAQQVFAVIDSTKALLAETISVPGQYVAAMRHVSTVLGDAPASTTGGKTASGSVARVSLASRAAGASASVTMNDAARVRVVAALARCASLAAVEPVAAYKAQALRQSLQADVLMRSGLLTAAAMQVALADYSGTKARDEAIAQVLGTLDVLMPRLPDAAYEKAASARAAMLTALDAQGVDSTVMRDVVAATPAVVLAYELGVAEDVLIESNGVRHPLFVRGRVYG
jgi:prophage DNA circulation protein